MHALSATLLSCLVLQGVGNCAEVGVGQPQLQIGEGDPHVGLWPRERAEHQPRPSLFPTNEQGVRAVFARLAVELAGLRHFSELDLHVHFLLGG